MNNEMTTVAMQMILHAGDARTYIVEALQNIKIFNFEVAKEKINRSSPNSNKSSSRRS